LNSTEGREAVSDKTLLERARYWVIEDVAAGAEPDEEHLVLIGELCDALEAIIHCESCGGEIDLGHREASDWRCTCGMTVCMSCTDVFEHEGEGLHGKGDPAQVVRNLEQECERYKATVQRMVSVAREALGAVEEKPS
jgi:hypothetical protein